MNLSLLSRLPRLQRRTLALFAVMAVLLALLLHVALRSGPLAPIAVTVATVESAAITPALYGIGTVEARYTYRIGPTLPGRVLRVAVEVGDRVSAGQLLGEMDAVDLQQRIQAQQAALHASNAALHQATAREDFARREAERYAQLLAVRGSSEEMAAARQQELTLASAALAAARNEVTRRQAELDALQAQRAHLQLVSPVAGLVVARAAEPGSTVVAGQAVVEIVDPTQLWVHTRFDQISATGLAAALPASIILRSRRSQQLAGRVLRLEPRADALTEEALAKIVFDQLPEPLPPLGELAEVTVQLTALPAGPWLSNAALRTFNGQRGVWRLAQDDSLSFTPVTLGRSDLDGRVQILDGIKAGDRVIVHGEKALTAQSRIDIVAQLKGASK